MLAKKRATKATTNKESVEDTPTTVNQPLANLGHQPETWYIRPEGRASSETHESNADRMATVDDLDALDARLYNIGKQIEDLRKDYQSLFRKMIVERNESFLDILGQRVNQNGNEATINTDSEGSRSSYHSYRTTDMSDN